MSEVFVLILSLFELHGLTPIGNRVMTTELGNWRFTINGTRVPQNELPPFNLLVEWNGFPAGIISAYGGVIAAGDAANEDALIHALRLAGARTEMLDTVRA